MTSSEFQREAFQGRGEEEGGPAGRLRHLPMAAERVEQVPHGVKD